jgi:GNAT superfamily N-acetyltransferase
MIGELREPLSEADWAAYHAIRRHVLFELRGHGSAYDANHPDEHRPGHHPLILWIGDVAVGVIRIDVRGPVAILRRVAIRADLQRRGHGRRLLEFAEDFARAHGCVQVESHVDQGAIGFYHRCGYALVDANDTGGSPLMAKQLVEPAAPHPLLRMPN